MAMTYIVHIVAGTLGLVAGYVALYSAKGALVHRRSGMVFVYAMVVMSVFGMTMAVVRNKAPDVNIPAGMITSYLVITSLITVRPLPLGVRASRWFEVGALLVALGVGVTMLTFSIDAIANGGKRNGMPAFPFVLFATFGFLGVAGDLRVLRSGARTGAARVARHLWRMSMALFIAALSASVQIMKFIPRQARIPGLVMLPVLLVLATMVYWLWRVRLRQSLRGLKVLRGGGSDPDMIPASSAAAPAMAASLGARPA